VEVRGGRREGGGGKGGGVVRLMKNECPRA
jgi:hypothetical protein